MNVCGETDFQHKDPRDEVTGMARRQVPPAGRVALTVACHRTQLVTEFDVGRIRPKSFDVVVLARFSVKDVNDKRSVVNKDPKAIVQTLDLPRWSEPRFTASSTDLVDDRPYLALVSPSGHDKVIRNPNEVADVENNRLFRRFGSRRLSGKAGER